MERRHNLPPNLPSWPTREAMVARGLAINLPWLAFVNISFALMILLRDILFHDLPETSRVSTRLMDTVDVAMGVIILLAVATVILSWRTTRGVSVILLLLSLVWSLCCYWFVTLLHLPHVWPLAIILLLTAMAALYFYPTGLTAFIAPLWITLPIASVSLNEALNIRFAVVWSLFTLILICGRFILLRWFDEAWERNQQNQRLIARLDLLAHQDPLTETANRRAMLHVLENAVSQQRRFSVMMLDVDYFKRYNDTYGHQAGDACLVRVARVLKKSVRSEEDRVARYGGEEFLTMLFDCDREQAQEVAARVQKGLRHAAIPHASSPVSAVVTVSIGIATLAPGQTAAELIAAADAALYRAKEGGRNRWCSEITPPGEPS